MCMCVSIINLAKSLENPAETLTALHEEQADVTEVQAVGFSVTRAFILVFFLSMWQLARTVYDCTNFFGSPELLNVCC